MANSRDYSTNSAGSEQSGPAREARLTVRQAFTASLATLDAGSQYPFASLVSIAASPAGDPILLLSGLARHTQNIAENGRASLMIEKPVGAGDPLQAARVTLQGDIEKSDLPDIHARYLAHHPEAKGYADFSDFDFYLMRIRQAHFIAGFGRIHTFNREQVCFEDDRSDGATPASSLQAFSQSHQSELQQAWRTQTGSELRSEDRITVIAFDRDGIDVRNGEAVKRLDFPSVLTPGATLSDGLAALVPDSKDRPGD